MTTTAIFGGHVLTRCNGAQRVRIDHGVLLDGKRIAAVIQGRPIAAWTQRPGDPTL